MRIKKLIALILICVITNAIVYSEDFHQVVKADDSVINEKIYYDIDWENVETDGKIIVVLDRYISQENITFGKEFFNGIDIVDVKDLTNVSNKSKMYDNNFERILLLTCKNSDKQSLREYINKLYENDGVKYAGPNIYEEIDAMPNDPLVDLTNSQSGQWALDNIKAYDAWNFTTGSANIRVGILDTGIYNHEDLEMSSENIIDFCDADESTIPIESKLEHGTHIAGIIGAKGNNNVGVTGINWNVSLVQMKVGKTAISRDKVIEAIYWAKNSWDTDSPIHVLSYSAGNSTPSPELESAIRQYTNKGGLFVCSSGNKTENIDETNNYKYPAFYASSFCDDPISNMLVVGSIKEDNSISQFSNWGAETVSIYAPGENILSTYPTVQCTENEGVVRETATGDFFDCECDYGLINHPRVYGYYHNGTTHLSNGYHYMSGTSMATPYVAGVAALLLSLNPDLTAYQLKTAILNSAETINITLQDNMRQSVKKLNAYNAVKYVLTNNFNERIYVTNTRTESKYINNNIKRNYIAKLHTIEGAEESVVTISANNAMRVQLYDQDFDLVTNCITNNNSNNITVSCDFDTGVYYMTVEFVSDNTLGSIYIGINGTPHEHSLSLFWFYHDIRSHRKTCSTCQEVVLEGHYVAYDDVMDGDNRANCLGCLANLDLSRDIASIVSVGNRQVTLNGSYVLPSGIVVLKDEDVEAYLAGTLVFYNEDDLPTYI